MALKCVFVVAVGFTATLFAGIDSKAGGIKACEMKYARGTVVDGDLSEWPEDEMRTDFIRLVRGGAAEEGRYALGMRYDDWNLYFAFRAKGPSRCVPRSASKDEAAIFDGNDVVEFFFRTGGAHGCTQLAVASNGGRYDAQDDDGFVNLTWQSAVKRADDGTWSAELRIPKGTLGYEPANDSGFRMNVCMTLPGVDGNDRKSPTGDTIAWSVRGKAFSSEEDMAFVVFDSFDRSAKMRAVSFKKKTGQSLGRFDEPLVSEAAFLRFLDFEHGEKAAYLNRRSERARAMIAAARNLPRVLVAAWDRDGETFTADANFQMGLLERLVDAGARSPSFDFTAAVNERVHADFTLSALDGAQTVDIVFSDLRAGGGRKIPATAVSVERGRFLNTPADFERKKRPPAEWPELLETLDGPDGLKKFESGLYRLSVDTLGAAPGTYHGTMHVRWKDGSSKCPIALEVLPIVLPPPASQPINSYIFTTIPFAGKSGDAWGRFFRDHYLTDVSFEHPDQYVDGELVKQFKKPGEWETYVRTMCEYRTPPGAKVTFDFDLCDVGERLKVCGKYNLRVEMCNRNGHILADHLPLLAKEMNARFGIPPRNFVYKLGDEDHDPKFVPVAQQIRKVAPDIQVAMIPAANQYWDITVLSNGFTEITYSRAAFRGGEEGERAIEQLRRAGVRVKRYLNDASWAARTRPIQSRAEPWSVLIRQELDGYCCWTACCWPRRKYCTGYDTNMKYDYRRTPPEHQWGSQLIYIRNMGDWYKPVSCQRLEDIRDGFIDTLYWREAKRAVAVRGNRADEVKALEEIRNGPKKTFAAYDAARRQLGDLILGKRIR